MKGMARVNAPIKSLITLNHQGHKAFVFFTKGTFGKRNKE